MGIECGECECDPRAGHVISCSRHPNNKTLPPAVTVVNGAAPVGATEMKSVVVLPLEIARIVRNVFLPRNPNKLRSAHPETVSAAKAYIAAFEDAERWHNNKML